jgi:hypothetical protein
MPESEQKQAPQGAATDSGKQTSDNWSYEMELEAQLIFNFAFTAGGFWITEAGYKEGEYTVFEWTIEDEDPVNMEKAFLKELDDGSQWWRIAWGQNDESIVFEALLDPGTASITRLRVRDLEGITEDVVLSGQPLYTPPQHLDDDQIQDLSKGNVRVDTPAGRFQAKHLAFDMGGSGRFEWWITEKVPGSVVKYQFLDSDGSEVWVVSLVDYGKKAGSVLGSF